MLSAHKIKGEYMIKTEQIHFQNLRKIIKEKTNDVIFWCGAGLSSEAGLPSWSQLKDRIITDCTNEFLEEDIAAKIKNIKLQADFWVSFSMIKKTLGQNDYQALIKKYLDKRISAPPIYKKLWELDPKGMITVNIDRFASTSCSLVFPGKRVNEFEGYSLKDNYRLLKSPDKYIVNIHGNIDKPNTWVFTKEELKALQEADGYYEFLTSIFTLNTVVFIGISADDVAVGGILDNLVNYKGIDLDNHYWITDRTDSNTKRWADSSHVNIIKYSNGKHSEVIEYIDNILRFVSKDDEACPVFLKSDLSEDITHDELIGKNPNEIRLKLNRFAGFILKNLSEDSYKKYFEFLTDFDLEVHTAWYLGLKEPHNLLFDYKIIRSIGSGSFGTVYEAEKDGKKFAIKMLHQEIRHQESKFKSFRRGVRSLNILFQRSISGIVCLYEATEIPAIIVMDYIEGMNLRKFVEMGYCATWDDILDVAYKLCKIIVASHSVPERVLHRDLKPTNIFLKDYFNANSIDLVITDFDFSWHKDALESDIPRNPSGYIAPEQVNINNLNNSRSSLVDSYSIGMILYYMVSKKEPLFKAHLMKNWTSETIEACKLLKSKKWTSIPIRFNRLINNLTIDQQRNRITVTEAMLELERLSNYNANPSDKYVELLAEELMYKMVGSEDYSVNKFTFHHNFASGITVDITFSETDKSITMFYQYAPSGPELYKNIKKYLPDKYEKINRKLKNSGWNVNISTASNKGLVLSATIPSAILFIKFKDICSILQQIKYEFNFI